MVMKRNDLMKQLAKEASQQGVEMTTREGGNHTVVILGKIRLIVPRHREINELTARGIIKESKGDMK